MMQIIFVAAALLVGLIAGMIVHYFVVRAAGSKSVAAATQMKNDAEREVSPVRPAQDAIIFKIDDISYDDMLDVVIKKYQEIMK